MSKIFEQYIHKDKKVFASNGQTSFLCVERTPTIVFMVFHLLVEYKGHYRSRL